MIAQVRVIPSESEGSLEESDIPIIVWTPEKDLICERISSRYRTVYFVEHSE